MFLTGCLKRIGDVRSTKKRYSQRNHHLADRAYPKGLLHGKGELAVADLLVREFPLSDDLLTNGRWNCRAAGKQSQLTNESTSGCVWLLHGYVSRTGFLRLRPQVLYQTLPA